jgi:hypothetical protein
MNRKFAFIFCYYHNYCIELLTQGGLTSDVERFDGTITSITCSNGSLTQIECSIHICNGSGFSQPYLCGIAKIEIRYLYG